MALVPALDDVDHMWGGDLRLSPTGDLARANGAKRSEQRVLRRLMTNLKEYIWEPTYGGSLPKRIGEVIDLAKIATQVRGQMLLEASVSQAPEPFVSVVEVTGGVQVKVQYVALPDKQPVSLSFDVSG